MVGWPGTDDEDYGLISPLLLRGGGGSAERNGAGARREPTVTFEVMPSFLSDSPRDDSHREDSRGDSSRHRESVDTFASSRPSRSSRLSRRRSVASQFRKRRMRKTRVSRHSSRASSARTWSTSSKSIGDSIGDSFGSDDLAARLERQGTDVDERGDDGDPGDDGGDAEGEEDLERDAPRGKMRPRTAARAALVAASTVLATASFGVALAASATLAVPAASMAILGVAGGVCLLTSPLVLRSEWRLARMPAMRRRLNEMKVSAKDFKAAVDLLRIERDELELEAESLQDSYERLEELVKDTNAGNINELLALVHENQSVLDEMKNNLRERILQDVVKMVLQSDLNRDGHFSKREASILEARLHHGLHPHGIVFDHDKFRRAVGLSPSLAGVLCIVRRLVPEWDDDNKLRRRSTLFGDDSDDEETDDEWEYDDDEVEEDVYDMFYQPLREQCERGNADAIQLGREYQERRGERPDLVSISSGRYSRSIRAMRSSVGLEEMMY